MNTTEILNNVLSKLEDGLPPHLHYHDADHTRTVIEQSIFLANQARLTKTDINIIKIAAVYHDSGFLIGREDHEKKSCKIASKELPGYNFSEKEIKLVCGIINATRIPQKTHNLLENIVADADLFYLGTDKYEYFSKKLYLELKHYNPKMEKKEWLKIQLDFLRNHKFHTKYGLNVLEPVKQQHLERLIESEINF